PRTHPHISTGLKENKFGIDMEKSVAEYRRAAEFEHIEIVGVDCHIGSQIVELMPFLDALNRMKSMIELVRAEGINIRYFDIGGGLGITYDREEPPHPDDYARAIVEEVRGLECTVILEPGRVIAGNAGILVTRVLFTKERDNKRFTIVDAGMNDLIRPSLYDSYHRVLPVRENDGGTAVADIVGPICESGDFLVKDREMPRFERGDLIAVMSAGAYGFTMSSNYNSRPRAAEVLVSGNQAAVIRKREGFEDLVRGETLPGFLLRHDGNR
ncbi:MAG TPA: diaminopimelate decarboxylase, partial [Deltaproteobacteria bacterium]|nr:diaminopimelate decarboxylase [Deltaproteobacteria bacterium]